MPLKKRSSVWLGLIITMSVLVFALSRDVVIKEIQSITYASSAVIRLGASEICIPDGWFLTAKRDRGDASALIYGFLPASWVSFTGKMAKLPGERFFSYRVPYGTEETDLVIVEMDYSFAARMESYVKSGTPNANACRLVEIQAWQEDGLALECPSTDKNEIAFVYFPKLQFKLGLPKSYFHALNVIRPSCLRAASSGSDLHR